MDGILKTIQDQHWCPPLMAWSREYKTCHLRKFSYNAYIKTLMYIWTNHLAKNYKGCGPVGTKYQTSTTTTTSQSQLQMFVFHVWQPHICVIWLLVWVILVGWKCSKTMHNYWIVISLYYNIQIEICIVNTCMSCHLTLLQPTSIPIEICIVHTCMSCTLSHALEVFGHIS